MRFVNQCLPPAAGSDAIARGLGGAVLIVSMLLSSPASAESLKAAYDRAGPAGGYDKYLVLETGVTYTGGLWIGGTFDRISATFEQGGSDVRIVGNGAILDLQGGGICMAYCNKRLDLDDCIILNGDIKFRGYEDSAARLIPQGSVRYVTFYRPHDYGVRMFHSGEGVLVERNLVVDAIDTGPDFMYLSGLPSDWLPTGASFSLSLQGGQQVLENWSYHTDSAVNADPLRHFNVLCDYG